ncbi:Nonsense-mediated mRNA decay factor SMG8 [Heracleum sosnowskyi]|uniref:Nonsense-mediated mRNA decay factor SMG8 n=1 Tax=Heracleum sosnowskyi TaxID=360622 RepID=A0AAD8N6A0_9APIA|nr:Nonsense-mediated mRNA decay factor SMG8 [Heracleum sosnowskyi]
MDLNKPTPSPKRVLIRPPQHPNLPISPNPNSPLLGQSNGVVVVGFIGRQNCDVGQLINRVLDTNVFGSGNLDRTFGFESGGIVSEELKDWLKCRKISFFHDEDKGILYLQFSSIRCPVMEEFEEGGLGFDSVLEEREFGDLQGMLFMFSVCHVIVIFHEGSRFDVQILKKFRILQSAKHAMAPFVRSRTTQPLPSKLNSSSSQVTVSGVTSNRSPGKAGGILRRNGSSISLMSGLGSYNSLFPGQCTPVTLFVFLDDFSDDTPGSNVEETVDASLLNQSLSSNSLARSSLPTKGSGPVVVLSRAGKSEGGIRKKLQSSLEAQIRFSIKKCRTLTGTESGYAGRKGGGMSSSAPLFSLDAAKAVALVDRSSNQRGESLDFATSLIENILDGTRSSDSLLLESHNQSSCKEDIISVKEFIYRQADILRGRGGVVANTNNGSAVGMVAVAAAAAAASAASGKALTTPDLPSLEIWLSSCQQILHGILSAKRCSTDEPEISTRKSRQRNAYPPVAETKFSKLTDPLEIAVSFLESGKGLNTRFSTLWCQKALPVAKDVYLNDLPPCYPTSVHKAHLEKALGAFSLMVKGPAVQLYLKKLEEECTSIWSSGRQLCDAVSLTGKPCMHQRHDAGSCNQLAQDDEIKPHSSGFVFLHACACGRLRRLRTDPFDFEAANVTSSCYQECDKLLSAIQLPQVSETGPIQSSSWSLIRVGGARYYEPAKGLRQSGFSATQKFLLKWKIFLEKSEETNEPACSVQEVVNHRLNRESNIETVSDADRKRTSAAQLDHGEISNEVEVLGNSSSDNKFDNSKIRFGKGPSNFTMRKPFSEVVAGSTAADSGFPPLQSKKQTSLASDKGMKQHTIVGRRIEPVSEKIDNQGSQKVEESVADKIENSKDSRNSDLVIEIGSNVISLSSNTKENSETTSSSKHVTVYFGFEHECPRGHRFMLTPELLSELGSSYAVIEESHLQYSFANKFDHEVAEPTQLVKNGGRSKVHRNASGILATATKDSTTGTSKDVMPNFNKRPDGLMQYSLSSEVRNSVAVAKNTMKDVEDIMQSVTLEDNGNAFSLLDRNLPIYMKCPHCRTLKNRRDPPNVKYAGTISQLQRIFLVTPAFPVLLATCPVVQFEKSCLPLSVPDLEQKLQFTLGCQVILPPESFLSLRLPFVYGVQLEDGSLHPLGPFEDEPELTAWITKSTTLQPPSNLDSSRRVSRRETPLGVSREFR